MVGLDEWIDNGCELTDSWIYDTNSEKGWVYWGQPLKHVMNTTSTLKSKTDDLIESSELIKSSAGRIIYAIYISLDALSYDYLDNWDDAPKVLIDSFKNNKEDSNHLDFTKITKSYRVAKEKNDRLSSINRYVKDSYINFKSTLDKVAEMLITLNAENQEEIDALEKKLNDSLSSLKLNIQINTTEYGSRILDFAGLNWNVIDSKYGINYFIVSDPLSRKELIEVGVAEELLVDDEIFFSENKNYGDGYSDSLLSIVNTRFYDQNIANTYFEDFVVPVSLGNEKIISNNTIQENLTRTDSPTKIDYKNGKKQAFTLSMSDWNSSSARVLAGNLYGNIKLWTTTPGELDKSSRVKNIVSMLFE